MNTYEVEQYSMFSNAVTTTNNYKSKIEEAQTSVQEAEQVINNTSVFMGPIQENCAQEFQTLKTGMTELADSFQIISSYITQVDTEYKKGDTDAANTVLGVGSTTGTGEASANSASAIASGAMVSYTFNGRNFNVTNTKISLDDYANYVTSNKMYQNANFLDGQCMLLSQYYATDLLRGTYTRKSTMLNHEGSPATRINERTKSTNAQDVLNYTYSELSEGHPVVLQVSQVHSDEGDRHLVTAVGYDSSVTQASDLTPDNILVLDCVDGKVQTLGQARSEGGHERRLFAQGGNYQALGPTETFLQKEVNV